MKIIADATLPNLPALFSKNFQLDTYENQSELSDKLASYDVLICRSTLRINEQLLKNSHLKCIATASSGIDHIDEALVKQKGITLFDAKGCNARAVADYVVTVLALVHEKLPGNRAGIIGVGEVGHQVARRLQALGFEVLYYDPLKASQDSMYSYCSLSDLTSCDLLCIHANLHESLPHPSKNLLNEALLAQLKPGVILVNAARGGIVDEEALLNTATPLLYCTDVYSNEPAIDPRIVARATVCTPHIAGHSIEAKLAAVSAISEKIHIHYGYSVPSISRLHKKITTIPVYKNWPDCVLSLYNPLLDTCILKKARDKQVAFLQQRKAHQYRHDFISYDMTSLDSQIKSILGSEI
ncbi:4-phosphoerythronate dehydrogenase [Legionella septentrionalis]|uniref:4-phosphoerythronate dehydrogenase n=1 Tax=Legionella septentrionalis TaxID=2498109 RepID=UPI000F8E77D8|nr:4-phosphoerythronate dehydrogenase [Legionella septentrionalis]RUR17509.1 4-phosphoerythronate dehydrogenase [Legionella septentrionalis]